jgi:hypothetical protein
MAELISLKNSKKPGRLPENAEKLFYTACYDIDRFREQVFEEGRWDDLASEVEPDPVKDNDVAVMKFGMAIVMNYLMKSD